MLYRLSLKVLPEGVPLFSEAHFVIFNDFMSRFGTDVNGLTRKVWQQQGGGIVLWGGDGRHWYKVLAPGEEYRPEDHPGYNL